jgi:hypothetical protein
MEVFLWRGYTLGFPWNGVPWWLLGDALDPIAEGSHLGALEEAFLIGPLEDISRRVFLEGVPWEISRGRGALQSVFLSG